MRLVDFQMAEGNGVSDQDGARIDCTGLQYGDEVFVAVQALVGGGGNFFFSDDGTGDATHLSGPWGAGTFGRSFDSGVASDTHGAGIAHKRIYSASDPEGGGVDDLTCDGTGALQAIGYRIVTAPFGACLAAWVFRGDGRYTPAGLDADSNPIGDGSTFETVPSVRPLDIGAKLRNNQAVLGFGSASVYNSGYNPARAVSVSEDSGFADFLALNSNWFFSGTNTYPGQAHRAFWAKGAGTDAERVTFTADEVGTSTDNWVVGALLAVVNFTTPFDAEGVDSWTLM